MLFSKDLVFFTLFSLFFACITSAFDLQAKTNVATYYGQGPSQKDLLSFCAQSSIDLIPIAFVTAFPAQGNGYVVTNFGNRCGAQVYSGPGYNGVVNHNQDGLLSNCPELQQDISTCQDTYGKKILLSLGGATAVQLSGTQDGEYLADFLWGAFGPENQTWINEGNPRPFGASTSVDGFDFDIENQSTDAQVGYIACIKRLRYHFQSASKQFLITGAPQCIVPDANMGNMIQQAQFDIIWVQFYNTPFCSARAWVNKATVGGGFSYETWANFLVGTQSAAAKLYIGLPGSTIASGAASNYLNPTEADALLKAFFCQSNFGGVMLWDATYADNNINNNMPYYETIKNLLLADSTDSTLSCGSNATYPSPTITPIETPTAVPTEPVNNPYNGISNDGTCGLGRSCQGTSAGPCCSEFGFCGSGAAWCGAGCQSAFGSCSPVVTTLKTVTMKRPTKSTPYTTSIPPKSTTGGNGTSITLTIISSDGTCGGQNTCKGLPGEPCCSGFGFCGFGAPWCGTGCQPAFGRCS